MIKLASYGKDVVLKVFLTAFFLIAVGLLIGNAPVKFILIGLAVFLWLFTLYFFRDPERSLPLNFSNNMIISPADGKVVLIKEIEYPYNDFFEKGKSLTQISIFLSPLNVHVNRIPFGGIVKFIKYVKGDYLVAFDEKSSLKNERSEIGIEDMNTGKKVLFKQIAGYVARRIVYELSEGNEVKAGERFGMIKFGSRMDILIEKNSRVLVKLDQKVYAGETILAEM